MQHSYLQKALLHSFARHLLIALAYFGCFILLIFLISNYYYGSDYLKIEFLYNWDAEHYNEIKNNGYLNYLGRRGDERAFFPLFPIIWNCLDASPLGMSLLNLLLFGFCHALLMTLLKTKPFEGLVFLSFPSLIFMGLPYTESTFYAGSLFIIYGMLKHKMPLVIFGFFIITLIRPAYSILLPAFIITQILSTNSIKVILKNSFYVFMATAAGTLSVAYIQYLDTGTWFGFITAQQKAPWFNVLQTPTLPYRSWSQFPPMPLDAMALTIGVLCTILLLKEAYLFLLKKKLSQYPKEMLFSMLYLSGICLAVFLFRGGSFHSLNRFVFCTVFAPIFIFHGCKLLKNDTQVYPILFFSISIVWFFFNGFTHIRLILSFFSLALYMFSFTYLKDKKGDIRLIPLYFILLSGITVQLFFLFGFFNWVWIA